MALLDPPSLMIYGDLLPPSSLFTWSGLFIILCIYLFLRRYMFLLGIGLSLICRYSSSTLELLHYGGDIMSPYFLPMGGSFFVYTWCMQFLGSLEYSIHPCILFSSLFGGGFFPWGFLSFSTLWEITFHVLHCMLYMGT